MKPICLFILIAYSSCNIAFGQISEPGAEAGALGGAYISKVSVFSSGHNIATSAFLESSEIGAGLRNNYLINTLNDFYLHGAFKLNKGTLTADFSYYGFEAYQEGSLGLGYAVKLASNWSAGLRLRSTYNHLPEENTTRYLISGDFGVHGHFKHWRVGCAIHQFAQSQWIGSTKEQAPIVFRLGGGYYFLNQSAILAEAYKAGNASMDFRVGLNYKPADRLDLRIGFTTLAPSFSFGLGIQWDHLAVNIAAGWHQQLGLSPVTDVVYAW